MTNILIADDHFAVRFGLEMLAKDILGKDCTFEHASSGEEVVRKIQEESFQFLLLDMNMPGPSGLFLLEQVISVQPNLKVLVISMHPEAIFAEKCFQLGANGFITKNASDEELQKAMQNVLLGQEYIPASILADLTNEGKATNPLKGLSVRELDVTMLLLKGQGILEIANSLSIKASTASTFKGRIFRKLGVTSLMELEQLAKRHGLIQNDSIES